VIAVGLGNELDRTTERLDSKTRHAGDDVGDALQLRPVDRAECGPDLGAMFRDVDEFGDVGALERELRPDAESVPHLGIGV